MGTRPPIEIDNQHELEKIYLPPRAEPGENLLLMLWHWYQQHDPEGLQNLPEIKVK